MGQPYHLQSAASTNLTLVKKNFTVLGGWYNFQINDAPIYILCYDAAATADVTVGTTPVKWKMAVPNNATAANGAGANSGGHKIHFQQGLVIAIVKGIAASSTTAVDADEVVVNLEID